MLTAVLQTDIDAEDEGTTLSAWEIAIQRKTLERSFYSFLKEMWSIVEPSRPLTETWHIEALCTVCEEFERGDYDRVIVNIPPGTLKSLIISVFFPAWLWARNAGTRVLAASYGQHLSIRDNLRVRQVIESPKFQRLWPVTMVEDQNTKTRYNTSAGGWRIATSVEGIGTGEHPHYVIIDDPLTARQAESPTERTIPNGWFDGTISSRGATSKVKIIVIMQRLHQEDLSGHLLEKGGWHLVRFPMRYEKCTCPPDCEDDQRCVLHKADPKWEADPRDPRTEDGELLCPTVIDEKGVAKLEKDLGIYGAAGQLQQRPSPEGGGDFKREFFKYADAAPKIARRCRGWDTAATEKGGDWTVGVKISEEFEYRPDPVAPEKRPKLVSTGRFFVEDVQREQFGPDGVDKLMRSTGESDGKDVPVREEKEGGSAGVAVICARTKTMVGFDYKEVRVSGSKRVRAKPFRTQVEGGNVYLVRGPWNDVYLNELCNFPNGKNDDQVDGSSCAFNSVLMEPPPKKQRATW